MAVTVTYKGSSIAAFENTTKTLNTQGTYLEDDITIQDDNMIDAFMLRTLSGTYENSSYTSIGAGALMYQTGLTTINLPNVTSLYSYAIAYCTRLTSISIPQCSSIYAYVFQGCSALPSITTLGRYIREYAFYNCSVLSYINFASTSVIYSHAFRNCVNLNTAIFGYSAMATQRISTSAFQSCHNLLSLYLLNSSVYTLYNISVFYNTPISTYTTSTGGVHGSIFVPSSLYSAYISTTNWATYSNRIVGLTDEEIQRVISTGTHVAS